MALLHRATLTPAKLDLLGAWLPGRPWTPAGEVTQLGAYRFDDPAGEVGIEAFLLAVGDRVLHVPVTYRAAPLEGAEEFLVGTTDHSVLGRRWVYDGCGDPVWAAALTTAVLTGGTQAEQFFEVDGGREVREPTATVRGSGAAHGHVERLAAVQARDEGPVTVVRVGAIELVVVRVVGGTDGTGGTGDTALDVEQTLTGRWPGGGPAVLAGVRPA